MSEINPIIKFLAKLAIDVVLCIGYNFAAKKISIWVCKDLTSLVPSLGIFMSNSLYAVLIFLMVVFIIVTIKRKIDKYLY